MPVGLPPTHGPHSRARPQRACQPTLQEQVVHPPRPQEDPGTPPSPRTARMPPPGRRPRARVTPRKAGRSKRLLFEDCLNADTVEPMDWLTSSALRDSFRKSPHVPQPKMLKARWINSSRKRKVTLFINREEKRMQA